MQKLFAAIIPFFLVACASNGTSVDGQFAKALQKAERDCMSNFVDAKEVIASTVGVTFIELGEGYAECEWDVQTGEITREFEWRD